MEITPLALKKPVAAAAYISGALGSSNSLGRAFFPASDMAVLPEWPAETGLLCLILPLEYRSADKSRGDPPALPNGPQSFGRAPAGRRVGEKREAGGARTR